jgi:two-component system sensor histidine kinase YesM
MHILNKPFLFWYNKFLGFIVQIAVLAAGRRSSSSRQALPSCEFIKKERAAARSDAARKELFLGKGKLQRLMRNWPLRSRSFMSELMFSYVAIILIFTVISLYYLNSINVFVREKVVAYNTEIIKQAGQKIEALPQAIDISSRQLIGIATNQYVFNPAARPPSVSRANFTKTVEESLRNVRRSYPVIAHIVLWSADGEIYTTGNFLNRDALLSETWMKAFLHASEDRAVIPAHHAEYLIAQGDGPLVISFLYKVKELSDIHKDAGYILVELDYKAVASIMESISTDENGLFLITDSEDRILYLDGDQHLGDGARGLTYRGYDLEALIRRESGSAQDSTVRYEIQDPGWQVIGAIPLDSIQNKFNRAAIASLIVFPITVLLSLLAALAFSKRITQPVTTLMRQFQRMGEGEFKKVTFRHENREMQALSASFNSMVENIDQLMVRVAKNEAEKTNARFIALQAQINPHFLYNTLETIRSLALRNDPESIASITKSMAAIFRYSIDTNSDITSLREEIEHVKNYARIQKFRFGSRFDVFYDIDDTLLDSQIIKLVLQPLVENAIYHGIEMKKKSSAIRIECVREGDDIVVSISDEGVGISKEKMALLTERMTNYEAASVRKSGADIGIGILNVNARLKFYYGEAYGLSIDSQLGKGTTVTVRIPYCPERITDKEQAC